MKYQCGIFITYLMLGALFVACTSASADKHVANGTFVGDSTALELPLPTVPNDLTEPGERAAYVMFHFWDELDFSDTTRCLNKDFVEQNFSNFVSLFPIADVQAQKRAVSHLMARAAVQSQVYDLLVETARKYLYDPNSPMLNEEYYAIFVESALSGKVCTEAQRIRLSAERGWIGQNRVGTPATDFEYMTNKGKVTSLRETEIAHELLLVLYDPTCDNCHKIIDGLKDNAGINDAIAEGSLQVLAINLLCDESPSELPDTWMQGTDISGIQDRDLYIIRATPSLYLLDSEHRVVAKDIAPAQILGE